MTVGGAETVGAGVAAADDDHVLALDVDGSSAVALLLTVGERQVLHRLVHAGQLAAGHRKVAPGCGAGGQHHGVVRGEQHFHVDTAADCCVGAELGALGLHLLDATVEVTLLHLELGNAVAQQAADAIGTLEHHDVVARPRELLCCCWD